jgi:hypothetical protein
MKPDGSHQICEVLSGFSAGRNVINLRTVMGEQLFCSKIKFHFGFLKTNSTTSPTAFYCLLDTLSVGSHTCSEKRHVGAA